MDSEPKEAPLHEGLGAQQRRSHEGVARGVGGSYSRQNENGIDGVEGHSWGHLGCCSRLEAAIKRSDGHESRDVESQVRPGQLVAIASSKSIVNGSGSVSTPVKRQGPWSRR